MSQNDVNQNKNPEQNPEGADTGNENKIDLTNYFTKDEVNKIVNDEIKKAIGEFILNFKPQPPQKEEQKEDKKITYKEF